MNFESGPNHFNPKVRLQDFRIASISGGVLAYLVLGSMWRSPVILFWQLLGNFPVTTGTETSGHLQQLLFELYDPACARSRSARTVVSGLL